MRVITKALLSSLAADAHADGPARAQRCIIYSHVAAEQASQQMKHMQAGAAVVSGVCVFTQRVCWVYEQHSIDLGAAQNTTQRT